MEPLLISPADAVVFGIPTILFSVLIPVAGLCVFSLIIYRRMVPLLTGASDPRFDHWIDRTKKMLKFALAQYRQPRYRFAGILHILLFAGFVILSLRSITLVIMGVWSPFVFPGMRGTLGDLYGVAKDYAGTVVLITCLIAMIRRAVFKPRRYAVPSKYGKDHTGEAVFVLLLISTLMISDAVFEGSSAAWVPAGDLKNPHLPGTLSAAAANLLTGAAPGLLQALHLGSYFLHDLVFFFFLCFLPMGKHFHVITSFPNVYFMKLNKGSIKPVRWGVDEENLDQLESLGVKHFRDFTWKQMLDFYSCADCGRCSDNCPANAVGRPLSPRFISIKCRNYAFGAYPILGKPADPPSLIGGVLEEDEIWSCTTCGACEEECPILIEYIDKIVDIRRGLVDEGLVPQSLQKPLGSLEKRGNPYGKMEKKRGDWSKGMEFVHILGGGKKAETLYFVDSISSYDDRIQEITRSAARVLNNLGVEFGILGSLEADSGNEVRRFGEETLFIELKRRNTESIRDTGVKSIVTADPHAFNALKNEYSGIPPIEHIVQTLERGVRSGRVGLKGIEDPNLIFTYHDPCYLGRHNSIYDAPRTILDAIPGMRRVEMERSKDRSFCCGGGGLMLFYEPTEETRMGKLRVEMAERAGATVIITACPFCMVNIEDAIKTSGLEGKMQVMDIVELM
ncbi:MAG: (Fe-S)-binding protein, partial [Thermodesulfobacteriota bacterium]